jgi:hypothetical protein
VPSPYHHPTPKLVPQSQSRKGAGRAAQVVECLSSKCKALSSNPSATKKKKKKRKKERKQLDQQDQEYPQTR